MKIIYMNMELIDHDYTKQLTSCILIIVALCQNIPRTNCEELNLVTRDFQKVLKTRHSNLCSIV
ncbi:hypothetical protein Hanom_Chr16g01522571 [Helianthus anomalus]